MAPPTEAQQKGMAYAHIPFATVSFFSCGYVIYYLLYKERKKLKRLYHRLILAMNFALIALSIVWVWRPFAVPEGTPYSIAATGTIQTCTASGFLFTALTILVPTYYSSLSFKALVAIRNNFKEENYVWIEKYIHIGALGFSCAIATVYAATENYNPSDSGCYITSYPRGCESDPNVQCQRGKDLGNLSIVLGLGVVVLGLVFTPSMLIAIYCLMGKVQQKMRQSTGMQQIRESAKKQMMHRATGQILLYMFSFFLTWIFSMINAAHFLLTGEMMYPLLILGSCLNAVQGFVFAMVYFSLQSQSLSTVQVVHIHNLSRQSSSTVEGIRMSAERKAENSPDERGEVRETFKFNIFDGEPDESSPWARFIDEDEESIANADAPDEEARNENNIEGSGTEDSGTKNTSALRMLARTVTKRFS